MKRILAALLLAVSAGAFGQASEVPDADPVVEGRLKVLAEELRCLVCQNQTIADSNATLAVDLRKQIREQIGQGASDDQIRAYMVERYGDFVLYRPPFNAATLALWLGPALLLVGGALAFYWTVRRRKVAVPAAEAAADSARIAALLDDREPPATQEAPGEPAAKKPGKRGNRR